MKLLWLVLLVFGVTPGARAAEPDLEVVKAILREPSKFPWQEHAEALKPWLGDKALPLLATLLEDYDLGYEASETMLMLDPDAAAPLIFTSMPKSDCNVQYHTFDFFLRRIHAGSKLPVPTTIMHDAAVRCLEVQRSGDTLELEMVVAGLTGSAADFDLLGKLYHKFVLPEDYWDRRLRDTAEMALAQLGQPEAIQRIEQKLAAPVPSRLSFDQAEALEATIREAGCTRNPRFIPLLARHLDDPSVSFPSSDNSPPDPAGAATMALEWIVNHADPESPSVSTDWKKWWSENQSRFSK